MNLLYRYIGIGITSFLNFTHLLYEDTFIFCFKYSYNNITNLVNLSTLHLIGNWICLLAPQYFPTLTLILPSTVEEIQVLQYIPFQLLSNVNLPRIILEWLHEIPKQPRMYHSVYSSDLEPLTRLDTLLLFAYCKTWPRFWIYIRRI